MNFVQMSQEIVIPFECRSITLAFWDWTAMFGCFCMNVVIVSISVPFDRKEFLAIKAALVSGIMSVLVFAR
jgi:hypothetical protein